MTNPTSNFGWQMPESTDLVTNLPADFEVFGQAVDTDFADLNGGTTGQVLSKTSNTDLDFTWVAPTAGDIEGVTAGIGISGGGTSGTVTVTNSMATAIDAKGDLVVGTGADAFSRLAVGTDTFTLVADSAEATGLKWAAPAGGGANWSLLNSGGTALTGATTITVSGISGKDKIMMLVEGASANAAALMSVRLNTDTASNYRECGLYSAIASTYSNANYEILFNAANKILFGQMSNNAGSTVAGYIEFSGCNSSGLKMFNLTGGGNANAGAIQVWYQTAGYYNSASAISSISLVSSSGNFDGGEIYVYTSA